MTVALIDDFGLLVIQSLARPAAPTVTSPTLDRAAGTFTFMPATWPVGTTELLVAFAPRAGSARVAASVGAKVVDISDFYPGGIPEELSVRITAISDNAGEEIQSEPLVLLLPAPVAVGTPQPVSYTEDTGDKTVATAAFFTGAGLSYALVSPPAGVSIDSGLGIVTISTTNPLAASTVTVRASNSSGSAEQSFSVTVTAAVTAPAAVGTISDRNYIQNTGPQTVETAANFSGTTPLTFSLVSPPAGVSINSSTGVVTIVTTSVLAASTVRVRASNAAPTTADQTFTVRVEAAVVAPAQVGTISDVLYTYGTGNQTVAAAAAFSGTAPLAYDLTAAPAGVTVNASTGVVTISTAAELTNAQIIVRATNSAGNASQSFRVTVAWPASIDTALWPTTEVRDPAEAAANGFEGEDNHLKVVYSPAINPTPTGFVLRSMLLQGASPPAPTGALPAVTAGATFYSTGPTVESTAYPRLYWHHTASDTFKLASEQTPFAMLGLISQGGTLPQFPTSGLNPALARPNIVYTNTVDGMSTGGNSPWSAVAAAYAAFAGQPSADDKVKSELASWLSNKGPSAQGNFAAKRDLCAATAIVLASRTPRIWDDFSAGQRNGLTAIIEGTGVMGACIYSDTYATPAVNLRGNPSNRSGNPNISVAYPALLAALRAFKGSNAATTSFLDNLSITTLRNALTSAGVSNMVTTYATSRPAGAPSLAQIEAACANWRDFRSPSLGVPDLFGQILIDEITRSCNKQAYTGYGGTAANNWVGQGVPNSGTPQRGRMINNNNAATIAPVGGQTGMFVEMNGQDAEGIRVSPSYSIWTGMNCCLYALIGMAAGLVTRTPAMTTAMNRLDVGWRTMKIHSDNGFYGWAHNGGTQSVTWTEELQGTGFGWSYAFPIWPNIVKPMYDAL